MSTHSWGLTEQHFIPVSECVWPRGVLNQLFCWHKGNRSANTSRKSYKQGLVSRATVIVLQIFDIETVQFLMVIGESTLNSEHKHLKHALYQHKASQTWTISPSLQKQELGSECQNTQGHYLFVISNRSKRRYPLPGLPHPAQANTGTEGWPKDPYSKHLKNPMEQKNAEVLAPLKSLLKLCHFNETKISYAICSERGRQDSMVAGLCSSSSSVFSYTSFVQADNAREEDSEGFIQNEN